MFSGSKHSRSTNQAMFSLDHAVVPQIADQAFKRLVFPLLYSEILNIADQRTKCCSHWTMQRFHTSWINQSSGGVPIGFSGGSKHRRSSKPSRLCFVFVGSCSGTASLHVLVPASRHLLSHRHNLRHDQHCRSTCAYAFQRIYPT